MSNIERALNKPKPNFEDTRAKIRIIHEEKIDMQILSSF